jgi:hypothetical protein
MKKLFAVLAALLAISAGLQLYFAAMGYFSNPDDHLMAIHGINGAYVLRFLPVILIIIGVIAKVGKTLIWMNVWVVVLTLLQIVLFILAGVLFGVSEESVEIPLGASIFLGLHGLVGLAIIGLAIEIARRGMMLAKSDKTVESSTTTT